MARGDATSEVVTTVEPRATTSGASGAPCCTVKESRLATADAEGLRRTTYETRPGSSMANASIADASVTATIAGSSPLNVGATVSASVATLRLTGTAVLGGCCVSASSTVIRYSVLGTSPGTVSWKPSPSVPSRCMVVVNTTLELMLSK